MVGAMPAYSTEVGVIALAVVVAAALAVVVAVVAAVVAVVVEESLIVCTRVNEAVWLQREASGRQQCEEARVGSGMFVPCFANADKREGRNGNAADARVA